MCIRDSCKTLCDRQNRLSRMFVEIKKTVDKMAAATSVSISATPTCSFRVPRISTQAEFLQLEKDLESETNVLLFVSNL